MSAFDDFKDQAGKVVDEGRKVIFGNRDSRPEEIDYSDGSQPTETHQDDDSQDARPDAISYSDDSRPGAPQVSDSRPSEISYE